jgi:hypothetical protein
MICYRRRMGRNLPAYRDGVLYRYLRDDITPGCIWLERDGRARRVSLRNFERIDGEPGSTVLGPCDVLPYVQGRPDGGPPDSAGESGTA